MRKISCCIGDWCRQLLQLSEEEYQILLYGLELIIGGALKLAVLLVIGGYIHHFLTVCLMILYFGIFRSLAGGYHSKTHTGCLVSMCIVCFSPVFLKQLQLQYAQLLWLVMLCYSCYQFWRYAPRNSMVNPIYEEGRLKRKRIGSLAALGITAAVIVIFRKSSFCWIPATAVFAEAVLISERAMRTGKK